VIDFIDFLTLSKKDLARLLALSLLILCAGIAVGLLCMGRKVEYLELQRETLQMRLVDQAIRLRKLEDTLSDWRHRQKPVIKEIRVHADLGEKRMRLHIEKAVCNMLQELFGRPVDTLDPPVVDHIISNRRIVLDDQEYVLTTTKVWVSEILQVWVHVLTGDLRLQE